MKFLVVLAVAVACVAADVPQYGQSADALAPVVKSSYEIEPSGNAFRYAYETGNGIYGQAEGVVVNPNSEYPSLQVKGVNKYTSPEGIPIETSYVADESGYQPAGAHLPVGPAIPDYIIKSLEYIAKYAKPEPSQKYNV